MIASVRQYLNGSGLGPTLVKAVAGSAGLRMMGMGFTFLVGVQLARGLGAKGYGIYGLAMSVIAMLGVPAQFGLPQLLTREVAASQALSDRGRILGILRWANDAVLRISLLISVAVIAWLALSGKGLRSELGTAMLVGLVMVPLLALGGIQAGALRGLQHIVKGQVPDVVVRPALFSLFLFAAPFAFTMNATLAMSLGTLSAGLALAMAWVMLRSQLRFEKPNTAVPMTTSGWWSSAIPMALTEGMRVLQGQAAILLLGLMSTVETVGVYRVASSVALIVAMPVTLFDVISAPIVARLYTQDQRAQLQRMLAWIALGMFSTTLFLALPFLLAGKAILGVVFGSEFSQSSSILAALCIGVAANGYFGANATLLNMTNHQQRVTRASAFSLLFLALLLPLMIWQWGGVGAALAVSIALTVWNICMWRDAFRLTGLDTSIGAFLKDQ